MRFGLMRRSSSDWIQTMSQLAQRANADIAQAPLLQAEARRINDALLANRVQDGDPTQRRKTLDRMTCALKRKQPLAAAFVMNAESPRRYQEERQALRMRLNLAAEAVEEREPAEALQHLQAANRLLAKIEPGVFAPEAHTDLPRALNCVELMSQGLSRSALQKTSALLLDVGARGPDHPSMAQARVLRAMLVQLTHDWDRCDVLWEHKQVDAALPALFTLLQMEHLFQLERATREKIAMAWAATNSDLEAYAVLDSVASELEQGSGPSADAGAILRFCADRRVRACYFAAQDDGVELPCLTPRRSSQWLFRDTCQKALEAFYKEQKTTFETEYSKGPQTKPFNSMYFNADICLRMLAERAFLDGHTGLEIVAMMHYFLEEMCMMPEA